jgi:hypothetical protein
MGKDISKILKNVYKATEAVSIEFAEYIQKNAQPLAPNLGRWITYEDKRELTTKELFKEFLESCKNE